MIISSYFIVLVNVLTKTNEDKLEDQSADVDDVIEEIKAAYEEEQARLERIRDSEETD